MIRGKYCRILFWLALTAILAAALAPNPVPGTESTNDKILHGLAFLLLSILGSMAYKSSDVTLAIFLMAYGFLIEFLQYFLPYRTFSLSDMLANASGIVLFLLIKKVIVKAPFIRRFTE